MAISTAVGTERVSKVVGYEVQKGNFQEETPNLPMRVAIFGQANTDKQSGLTNAKVEVTSENQAGQLFGFGSQIHIAMRIIRSRFGDVTGGIPTIVYPQLEPSAGVAQADDITITGAPTGTATHILEINGRSNFDGATLEFQTINTDTPTSIAQKIADLVNACLSCPVSAVNALGVATLTTKFKGEATTELDLFVNLQGNANGLTYTVTEDAAGAGDSSPEITSSLALFGEDWNTIVVTPYPQTRNALFEAVNGIPADGATLATGRYQGIIFKPFVLLSGNVDAVSVASVTANMNIDEVTVSQCPAPNSKGWNVEAAANVCALLARQAQDNPHLDTSGGSYPDMPIPKDNDIGIYTEYNDRDAIVKLGGSTVILNNGSYEISDQVTSYHPVDETPPQFRYVRSLIQDWNVRFGYFLLEQIHVVDHAISNNQQPLSVSQTVKPKQWTAILVIYFNNLAERALIVEVDFSVQSLMVATGTTNPDRLETFFRYKRSPFTRIASTTAEAGFAFGIAA